MARATVTLPSGVRARSQSNRRYIVVSRGGSIRKRSDSFATAKQEHRRAEVVWGVGSFFVWDTVTGSVSAEGESLSVCKRCGSTSTDPRGNLLHRFRVGEEVVSVAGMRGSVVKVPERSVGRIGVSVLWENGYQGRTPPANLDHCDT